ncbi:dethiobiotin synthase [Clostridium septicum]|uniref:ATP-dependent dethiobiotin synthetase BioD n=1 Tax=Clostridium septicum TaxID=1504 RepID=A0A9N7JKQ6_CLOSE|nr:dethiobiotin synthase [Clostridium septicum]AYE34208.1 dethiobiotin synthase [Clostridium septicum]QAS59573.1 dethiobiotin synthase [Clostridium septicum]UEC21161.1 dethiobiotin synthase [Clostridium septicum]USS00792.1 dethiobiotin synthase [Clostridium septicum]
MRKSIFITGTDTDVGKTFVASLIVKTLRDNGVEAGYFKGVLSGAIKEDNKLIPGDAKEVCSLSGLNEDYENLVSYTLENPYSPHLASRIEGIDINIEKIKSDYKKMKDKYELLVVEGSGGIICPINITDTKTILLEDIIKELELSTIVIARAGLGTINHTILTIKYLEAEGIKVNGVILNGYNPQNIIHKDNKDIIRHLTGINRILTIPFVEKEKDNVDNLINFNMLISLING